MAPSPSSDVMHTHSYCCCLQEAPMWCNIIADKGSEANTFCVNTFMRLCESILNSV